jgi:hypothetical protein
LGENLTLLQGRAHRRERRNFPPDSGTAEEYIAMEDGHYVHIYVNKETCMHNIKMYINKSEHIIL